MPSNDWKRLVDGMDDPYDGNDPLVKKRREALRDVLRLMGCNHPRNTNCDHVDAIRLVCDSVVETFGQAMVQAIRELPRPLEFKSIANLFNDITLVTLISTSDERRG